MVNPHCVFNLSLQLTWVSETVSVLLSDDLAKDVPGAEEMMERNQEIRAEIDAKNEKYAPESLSAE